MLCIQTKIDLKAEASREGWVNYIELGNRNTFKQRKTAQEKTTTMHLLYKNQMKDIFSLARILILREINVKVFSVRPINPSK